MNISLNVHMKDGVCHYHVYFNGKTHSVTDADVLTAIAKVVGDAEREVASILEKAKTQPVEDGEDIPF